MPEIFPPLTRTEKRVLIISALLIAIGGIAIHFTETHFADRSQAAWQERSPK